MRKLRVHILLFVLISLLAVPSVVGDDESVVHNDDAIVTLRINDAYYTDADGDGEEDDVISHFTIFTG
ncbi:MAG: hypothetical protein ACXAD7_27915 [Candidatus Kariarchaeaceae archaeon]